MKFTQNCIDLFLEKIVVSLKINKSEIEKLWNEAILESPPKVSQYITFMKEERRKIKEEKLELKFGEISKLIGEKWKEEKKKIIKEKRKPNQYLIFAKEQRDIIKKENPKLKFGEISKEISLRWKNKKIKSEKIITSSLLDSEKFSTDTKLSKPLELSSPVKKPSKKKLSKDQKISIDEPLEVSSPAKKQSKKNLSTDQKISNEILSTDQKTSTNEPLESSINEESESLPIETLKPPEKSIKEIIENIKEYELKGLDGEITKVPIEWTPWLVTKELQKHNINIEDLEYEVETPPPSPGPEMEVYDEEEFIDKKTWERWNDWCQNYYTQFVKDKNTLEDLLKFCKDEEIPVGPKNVMIVRLVEFCWYSRHHYSKRRNGFTSDRDFYNFLIKRQQKFPDSEKIINVIHQRYAYLKWPTVVRRPLKDEYLQKSSY